MARGTEREAKVRFSAETQEFNAALDASNDELRELWNQFRLNEAQMENASDATEGLQNKQRILNDRLEATQKKIQALNGKLQAAREIYGDNSDEVKKLEKQLTDAQVSEEKIKGAIDRTADALEGQTDATNETADATEELSDGFTVMKGVAADLISNGIQALIGSLKNAVDSLFSLSESTQEYREDLQKLDAAFETAGHTTAEATDVYKELYSVFGEEDRAVEAAQQIAKVSDNQEEMARLTRISTGAWAMWGDSLATESLMEAVNSTTKLGEVQGTLADALDWAAEEGEMFGLTLQENIDFTELSTEEYKNLTDEQKEQYDATKDQYEAIQDYNQELMNAKNGSEKFNIALAKCTSEQERSELIISTLEDLYGEAADTYKENNKSIMDARDATSDYNDTLADLGEAMEPLNTDITKMKTEFARGLVPAIKNEVVPAFRDFMQQLKDSGTIEKLSGSLGDLATTVLPPLASVLGFVAENWKALGVGIGVAVAAFQTLSVVSSVTTALQGATGAMAGLNAVMAANPIGAVVTAITALVGVAALLVDSYKNARDELDYVNEALQDNVEAMAEWQETMDNATIEIGDWSNYTNAAGETAQSLQGKMDEAQSNITQIWADAFKENRQLRDEEIESIKQYNEQYVQAQQELALLEQQKLQAQTDSLTWQIENMNLTAEQEQGILNKVQELRTEYNAKMSESVSAELVLLQQRLANGQITEQEYNTFREEALAKQQEYATIENQTTQSVVDAALDAQLKRSEIDLTNYTNREHAFQSEQEIREYYQEIYKQMDEDENLSWWDKEWARQKVYNQMLDDLYNFSTEEGATWTDYNFLTDENIQQNQQSFFNWIGNAKANKRTLSKENKETAKLIINAYKDLPEDLEESGLNSLRGLAEGMADEYPELEKAAEMDMDELIETMNSALGVASPSTKMKSAGGYVMDGLGNGMNAKLPSIRSVVTSIGESLISSFTSMFKIKSPSRVAEGWGKNIVEGLTNGIDENTDEAVGAAENQAKEIDNAYKGLTAITNDGLVWSNAGGSLSYKLDASANNSLAAAVASALERMELALYVDGKKFASATAGATDAVNGNRVVLRNRGVAL